MPSFELPAIRPDAHPEFKDSSACAAWLQSLPLINTGPSHARLLGQLGELNGCEVAPAERLKILELLREPVAFVQAEQAKKFVGRPVPLSKQEREVFHAVNALWDALSQGYQRCLQTVADGVSGPSGFVALACQRVLWCIEQKMVDYYEAYHELDDVIWRLLHRAYALAEERGVADGKVAHPVHKGKVETSCVETYAHALLLNLANPNEQTPRQIALVSRWLDLWAGKASIMRTPPEEDAPVFIDLASGTGASRSAASGDAIRFLEIGGIGKSVRKRVSLLRQGESPAALGLGEDVAASAAESLLVLLYRQWCEDKHSRAHARRSSSGTAQVCIGMGAIHYYVTGKPFRQQGESTGLSQIQHEELATFGRVTSRQEEEPVGGAIFPLETWQIKDESLSGMRLERLDPAAVSRLVLDQLLAFRPADAKGFLLSTVRWLSASAELELRAGVHAFPGMPAGIAFRAAGASGPKDPFLPALMLPAVAALHSPDTLVLPLGWFKPKRVIELRIDRSQEVRLSAVVERGADFERVSFERA